MEAFLQLFDADFVGATIRLSTPVLFATLGGILNERSGVINIGLEGIMLMAALIGVLGAWYLQDPWIGFLCGIFMGGLIAWVHAFVSVSLKANQIVSGAAINIIGLGMSSFLIRILFGLKDQQRIVPHFSPVKVPLLGDISYVGTILFNQHILVYVAFLLVPLFSIVLQRL